MGMLLLWAVELGCIDIITEAIIGHSAMGSRTGTHRYHHGSVAIIGAQLQKIYGDIEEEIPRSLPQSKGSPVQVSMFTDAAHAGDLITRRSQTCIIIMLNCAPILWHSK